MHHQKHHVLHLNYLVTVKKTQWKTFQLVSTDKLFILLPYSYHVLCMINNLPQIHPLKSQRISEQILVLMYKLAPTQKEECQIPKKLQRKSLQLNKSGVVCSRGSWIPILSPPPPSTDNRGQSMLPVRITSWILENACLKNIEFKLNLFCNS